MTPSRKALKLLREVTAHLRRRAEERGSTLREWAVRCLQHPNEQTREEAETTIAILDLLGEEVPE